MNPAILTLILKIAVILIAANIIRPLFLKLRLPPVIGLILLGVLLGPSLLHFAEKTETISWIAEIGVLLLIFNAGMETNLSGLKRESKLAAYPSLGGIILPFCTGYIFCVLFGYSALTSLMVGTIFTATSISISLMTLIEINKHNSIEGRCIVNSAIIDDILGIIIISFIFSILFVNTGSNLLIIKDIGLSVIKIILFFITSILAGKYVVQTLFRSKLFLSYQDLMPSITLAVLFLYAWFADILGLAAIIGAFVCGTIIGQTPLQRKIYTGMMHLGRSLFIDVFFVGIGLGLDLKLLTFKPLYQILFIVLAILSKIIGSSLGAMLARFDLTRSLRIGIGMVPRGEVALILSSIAYRKNLIDIDILSTTIILVIVTSLLTPFLLKNSFTLTKKKAFRLDNS